MAEKDAEDDKPPPVDEDDEAATSASSGDGEDDEPTPAAASDDEDDEPTPAAASDDEDDEPTPAAASDDEDDEPTPAAASDDEDEEKAAKKPSRAERRRERRKERPAKQREPLAPGDLAAALVLAVLALDLAAVAVALPAIQADLDLTWRELVWVAVAFLLGVGAGLPIGASLGTAAERLPMVLAGAVLLTAGTTVCALAPSTELLIAARAAQGVGGGLLLGLARPRRLSATVAVAVLAVAPVVGGAVVELLDWKWLFWGQLPLVLAAAITVMNAPATEGDEAPDLPGLILLPASLAALALAMVQADDWSLPVVLGLAGGGLIGLAALISLEQRADRPILDVAPFRDGAFAATAVAALALAGAFWAALVIEAQVAQELFDRSALTASLFLLALTVPVLLGAVLAGRARERFGAHGTLMAAVVVAAAGIAILGLVEAGSNELQLLPGLLLVGVGAALGAAALPALAVARIPEAASPIERRGGSSRARSRALSRPAGGRRTGAKPAAKRGTTAASKRERDAKRGKGAQRGGGKASEERGGGAKRGKGGDAGDGEKQRGGGKGGEAAKRDKGGGAAARRRGKAERVVEAEVDADEGAEADAGAATVPPERVEDRALAWSRLAGAALVLAAVGALFLFLVAEKQSELVPSAGEGGPGTGARIDSLLAGSEEAGDRLAQYSPTVEVAVEIAARNALAHAAGRSLLLAGALLILAFLLLWRLGGTRPDAAPPGDGAAQRRFPL